MAKRMEAWGVDVGSNAIKALKLVRAGSGVRVADFEIMPFKHVLTTPDLDVEETIRVQLDALIQKHPEIEKSAVVTSVPGNMAFARFAKLPPVEPKKIPDIVRFEAQQQIPFPIDQVEWDYQVFAESDSPDVEVGIFAITKERAANFLSNFRTVNMSVDALTLSPLAVYNAFRFDVAESEEEGGTVYMDIGTVSTDVIIVEDGGIWMRTLPIGGNNFTEALVKQFKISFPKAEKLKKEAATSKYAKQIFQAMRAIFADMVQEVQRSLGFYQSLNRDSNLTKLVGVGSTFKLPGLQKFLKQQLQIDIVRPDSYERISVDGKREAEFASHAINLASAYGLALQGLGMEKISANVLPSHILASRLWRSKQPWIAASAACFLAAAGVFAARYYMDKSAFESGFEESSQQVQKVLKSARGYEAEWNSIQVDADPRIYIENMRRLLDHRNIHSRLIEDITLAILALEPQEGLLTEDYNAISQIARDKRRRIFIDSVELLYEPKPKAEVDESAESAGAGIGGTGSFAVGGTGVDAFFGENVIPPRYVVRVIGTTPMSQPDAFLNEKFIAWLEANADRPDRPYTFEFGDETPIKSLTEITSSAASGAGAQPAPAANPFGNNPFGQQTPTTTGSSEFQTTLTTDVSRLLPTRPGKEESNTGDWRFELEWVVELKSPQDARPRVNSPDGSNDRETETPETETPKPESPSEGQPAASLSQPARLADATEVQR